MFGINILDDLIAPCFEGIPQLHRIPDCVLLMVPSDAYITSFRASIVKLHFHFFSCTHYSLILCYSKAAAVAVSAPLSSFTSFLLLLNLRLRFFLFLVIFVVTFALEMKATSSFYTYFILSLFVLYYVFIIYFFVSFFFL